MKFCEKCFKTAKKCKNRRIRLKYCKDSYENGLSVFPVPENPMIATKISALSAIGAKLPVPPTSYGGHLGFWPLDTKGYQNRGDILSYFI